MRQLLARLNPPAESAVPSIPVASIGPDENDVELLARIIAAMNLSREGLNQASSSGIDVGTASTHPFHCHQETGVERSPFCKAH